MSCSLRPLGALFLFLALLRPAWSQPLTLPDAQRLAAGRSQQLVATAAAATATREMAVAAGQLPDPVLTLGLENLPLSGPGRFSLNRDFMTAQRIGLMQELPRAEKRALRVERVQRDADRIRADRELALLEIQQETALAWIARAYSMALVELLTAQLAEARLQVQGAEVAFRGGRGGQADIFAARAEVASLQDRLRDVERQSRGATLALARWIGPEAAGRPLAGTADWRSSRVEEAATTERLRLHPRLALLQAQVQAAETELRLAQANTRADWTVEAGYSRRGPAYADTVSISVSVPLQLDRRNRQDREVAAKLAALQEIHARQEEALRAEDTALRMLVNDWTTGRSRLSELAGELLPAARNRTEAALAAYRAGTADLASALAARRDEIDARVQLLSLELEVARTWARLNYFFPDPSVASN